MPPPLLFDAHLDLAMNALDWNRDLTRPLAEIRAHAAAQISRLHAGIRRFLNPHQYPVGLEPSLHETRTRLVLEARGRIEAHVAQAPA